MEEDALRCTRCVCRINPPRDLKPFSCNLPIMVCWSTTAIARSLARWRTAGWPSTPPRNRIIDGISFWFRCCHVLFLAIDSPLQGYTMSSENALPPRRTDVSRTASTRRGAL